MQGRGNVNEVNRCRKETEKMIGNTAGQERKADDGNMNVCVVCVFTQVEQECVWACKFSPLNTLYPADKSKRLLSRTEPRQQLNTAQRSTQNHHLPVSFRQISKTWYITAHTLCRYTIRDHTCSILSHSMKTSYKRSKSPWLTVIF